MGKKKNRTKHTKTFYDEAFASGTVVVLTGRNLEGTSYSYENARIPAYDVNTRGNMRRHWEACLDLSHDIDLRTERDQNEYACRALLASFSRGLTDRFTSGPSNDARWIHTPMHEELFKHPNFKALKTCAGWQLHEFTAPRTRVDLDVFAYWMLNIHMCIAKIVNSLPRENKPEITFWRDQLGRFNSITEYTHGKDLTRFLQYKSKSHPDAIKDSINRFIEDQTVADETTEWTKDQNRWHYYQPVQLSAQKLKQLRKKKRKHTPSSTADRKRTKRQKRRIADRFLSTMSIRISGC